EHRQPLTVGGQLQQRGVERVGRHGSAPREGGAGRERVTRQLVVPHLWPRRGGYRGQGRGGERGDDLADAVRLFVGGVFLRGREPSDDGCVFAVDYQCESGRELADHLRGCHLVAGGAFLPLLTPAGVAAQLAR